MNNFKIISFIICLFLSSTQLWGDDMDSLFADYSRPINDGPYIFFLEDSLQILEITADSVSLQKTGSTDKQNCYINSIGHSVQIGRDFQPEKQTVYSNVEKFMVVSDIHGQFQLFCDLLINSKVIDMDLNWNWDDGHLVIAGDVFDRGEGVNESLWLIFSLSQQAETVGGKVHFLLGNHELMIIENDLRYVHEKYFRSARLMELEIETLYAENTLLGRWIRTLPTCLQINNDLIVHAGISPELMSSIDDLVSLNNMMQLTINGENPDEKSIDLLSGSLGPLWFRGYFTSSRKYEQIKLEQLNVILDHFEVDKIIVGHTTQDDIYTYFENKVIEVDASMKLGVEGKGLIYSDGVYRSVDSSGNFSIIQKK
jgi:calcineurin-like phosphoesterase family protein